MTDRLHTGHDERTLTATNGECPYCKTMLYHFDDYGVEHDYCPQCGRNFDCETGEEMPDGPEYIDERDITEQEIAEMEAR